MLDLAHSHLLLSSALLIYSSKNIIYSASCEAKKVFQFLLELILCARVSQPPIVSLFLTTWVLPQLPKCLDLTLQTVSALLLSVWREGLAQALAAVHFKHATLQHCSALAPFK